jgi:hypothetical protein
MKSFRNGAFSFKKFQFQVGTNHSFFLHFLYILWYKTGMGKKGKVKSNPHSKIDPIMPGH